MKGIALIGMLLALLIVAYLLMVRLNEPATETAIMGKPVPLLETPSVAREKLEEAMKKEAEHIQDINKE